MSETTVITSDGGNDDTATAFAAGVATATAAQATEDAAEAGAQAETAEIIADSAAQQAAVASETAWDARSAVDQLAATNAQQFAEIRDALAVLATPATIAQEEDDMAPEPVTGTESKDDTPEKETKTEAATTDSKAEDTERSYGSPGWFGKR